VTEVQCMLVSVCLLVLARNSTGLYSASPLERHGTTPHLDTLYRLGALSLIPLMLNAKRRRQEYHLLTYFRYDAAGNRTHDFEVARIDLIRLTLAVL